MSCSGLLTRKQFWRKQSNTGKRKDHDFLYNEGVGENSRGECPTRSASEPTLNGLLSISQLGRLWVTSDNLVGCDEQIAVQPMAKRRVAFQPLVRVVLIPSRNEYAAADLLATLWWEDSDYSFFKASAVRELKAVMVARGIFSSKEAIKVLYQPGLNHDDTEEAVTSSSPVSIDDDDCLDDSPCKHTKDNKESAMGLIEARTDVDLTDLKRHHGAETTFVELKAVHPLAYMCQ